MNHDELLRQRRRRADAKATKPWGHGLTQPVHGYRVAVTEASRAGRRKWETFVYEEEEKPGCWELVRETFRADTGVNPASAGHVATFSVGAPLPPTMDLRRGVSVSAVLMTIVLDALASDGRHEIDLADLKLIVSQLGKDISRLSTLPAEQRRIAEQALYSEILRRCTTL